MKQLQRYFKRPISLVMAEQASLQDAGMMGYLASTSLNLQQAMYLLEQYYPLLFQHQSGTAQNCGAGSTDSDHVERKLSGLP
jgi:hypothetical protein